MLRRTCRGGLRDGARMTCLLSCQYMPRRIDRLVRTSRASAHDQHLLPFLIFHIGTHVEASLRSVRLEQRLRTVCHLNQGRWKGCPQERKQRDRDPNVTSWSTYTYIRNNDRLCFQRRLQSVIPCALRVLWTYHQTNQTRMRHLMRS